MLMLSSIFTSEIAASLGKLTLGYKATCITNTHICPDPTVGYEL